MYDAIKNFPNQFEFEPIIENGENFHPGSYKRFIVAGMGGSQLAARLLKIFRPHIDIINWCDYDLPELENYNDTLVILSSHSGNTEEVISAFHEAKKRGLPMAAMMVGGELLELAASYNIPRVKLPDEGLQPRSALGHSFRGLLKLMGQEDLLKESNNLASLLDSKMQEGYGKDLAKTLKGYVPVVYASARHSSLAYVWKITFNETAKVPAFYNVFSELNHNEINGMGASASSKALTQPFHFIFLKSKSDHPRIQKRMEVTKKIYEDLKIPVAEIEIKGSHELEAVFSTILLGDWAAYYTAELYGHDSENVPVVEELKRLMK